MGPGGGPCGFMGCGQGGNHYMAIGGDPIFLKNGEFAYSYNDIYIRDIIPIQVTRAYGSRHHYHSRFGYGWTIGYNLKLRWLYDDAADNKPDTIMLFNDQGCKFEYERVGLTDIFRFQTNGTHYIEYDATENTLAIVRADGYLYHFDSNGNLTSIGDRFGNAITFEYKKNVSGYDLLMPLYGPSEFFVPEEQGGPFGGRGLVAMEYQLTSIKDTQGRTALTFNYNSQGLLESVVDIADRTWNYLYDPSTNDLLAVQYPPADTLSDSLYLMYTYDDKHNLTHVIGPDETVLVQNYYNSEDKVHRQIVGQDSGAFEFVYDTLTNSAIVTSREGHLQKIEYTPSGLIAKKIIYTDDPQADPNSYTTTYLYDSKSQLARIILPKGNCVDYTYNTNGYRTGVYRKASPSDPNDPTNPNVIGTEYEYYTGSGDPLFYSKITKMTDPEGHETDYEYYENGYLKKVISPAVQTPNGFERATIEYIYSEDGILDSVKDPNGTITKYIYYDTMPSDPNDGMLWKVIADYGVGTQYLNLTNEYTYDILRRVSSIKDAEGAATKFAYNNLDQRIQIENAAGHLRQFGYDSYGYRNVIKRQTSDSANPWQVTQLTYNVEGKLLEVKDTYANTTTYTYDKDGYRTSITNALNEMTVFEYDERGLLVKVTDPNNDDTLYGYDSNGNRVSVTDSCANITSYEYDDFDWLTGITDAVGNYSIKTLDKSGRVIREIAYDCNGTPQNYADDSNLMQIRYTYNEAYDLIEHAVMADAYTDALIPVDPNVDMVTQYLPAWANGPLAEEILYYGGNAVTDALAAVTYYDYDAVGRRLTEEDPDGNTTSYQYNDNGQVLRVQQTDINPLGSDIVQTTDFIYDELGHLRFQIEKPQYPDAQNDPSWQTTEYEYNKLGRRTLEIRPNGVEVVYGYDLLGRKTLMVIDPNDPVNNPDGINQVTEYGYDELGRQRWIAGRTRDSDPATDQVTSYDYDNLGRTTQITYPDDAVIQYDYTAAGKVWKRTDQRGWETYYTYDDNYNMTQKQVTVGSVTTTEIFTYDGLGRMLTAQKQEGPDVISFSEFAYNDIGKISDADDAYFAFAAKHSHYEYDNAGYRTRTTYPNTVQIDRTNHWSGRIDTLKKGTATFVDYAYVGDRIAQRKSGSYIYYEPGYDNLGRMTHSYTYETNGTPSIITDCVYTYEDNTNNIEIISFEHRPGNPNNLYNQYTYDALDRLTEADYLVGLLNEDESFGMDDLGNRTTVNLRSGVDQVYTTDDVTNRYMAIDSLNQNMFYDAAGNLTVDHDGYHYEYDYENRITRIYKLDGQTEVDVALYAYDALGRRIWKQDPLAVSPQPVDIYYYNNDQWQILCEYTDAATCRQWFTYGDYIDEVLTKCTSPTNLIYVYHYIHDHLFNVVAMANFNGATVVERYEYDAYGKVTISGPGTDYIWYNGNDIIRTTSAQNNPFTFTGRQLDVLDGGALHHMHYRYRDYSPQLGRFMQQDPWGIKPAFKNLGQIAAFNQYRDGMNLYEYVRSEPVIELDPEGRAVWYCYTDGSLGIPIGRHGYMYDDSGNGQSCGMDGSSGSSIGGNPCNSPYPDGCKKGPAPGTPSPWDGDYGGGKGHCTRIAGTDNPKDSQCIMQRCKDIANSWPIWFPWLHDCHNAVQDSFKDCNIPMVDEHGNPVHPRRL